ncbi:hypothetical protein DTL21_28265 [Bremerella cremea]|uniref:Glycosyl transferase n=1 Tax=Blastopirellula marina TaxID=124 RepID=A0A2S8F8K3_9BACT|nr:MULTISPECIES: hypothetical protein [Pirellulaceae]PQO28498.1 hypothetical protein C5Y83_28215 [Blastopirellula marina]RCS41868.1 hypothetical protein DTL21_28265 [Bremerella cremea]
MDVVYFLKHSPFDDFEIRYSLRSVAKHLPSVRKVWVFGDRPAFLSLDTWIVEHIPHETIAPVLGFPAPMTNFFQMLFASSLIPELHDEYLWFCDDFFLLKELPLESARTLRYLDNLDNTKNRGSGLWVDSLWRTYELLKRFNYPRLNFETHVPTYYRRKWPFEAYREFKDYVTDDRWFGMLGPTAILNHATARNELQPVSINDECSRAGFWGSCPNYDAIVEACDGKAFFNFDDGAFGEDVQRFLEERFPDPCRYEQSTMESLRKLK